MRAPFLDQGLSKEDKQDLAVIVFCAASVAGASVAIYRYLKLVVSKPTPLAVRLVNEMRGK